MIVRDPEKYAHHDRVFLNNPVVMQGMGLAPLVVLATTGKNALMLAVSVALLLTPSRMLACLLSRAFPLRDEQPAKEELEKNYSIKVLTVQADVNAGADNEAVVNHVIEETLKEFGRIDVLINNAQASASGVPLAEHTTEQFNLALYSGLYAAFYYMKACYPHLAKTKGSVINFASGAGLFGNFGQCAYAAAKEGIRGLTRVAATEWAKDGINVNIICPLAWTAQLEQFQKAYPDAFEKNVHTPPAGHFGDAELEIGRVCVQLASPDFKYMTGETLTLEGGLGQRP